ncbi:MAG: CinA family protein [Candidatus Omnitrophota bacterium]
MLKLHRKLIKSQRSVSVAESCTGGLLSKLLTDHSGSSQYFILGVVCYSNKAKKSILKVPDRLIRKNGAVSEPVAVNLAQNIRKLAKTDFGIGITGIAGPTGGTPAKPVGTVFIAIASKTKTTCRRLHFKGRRNSIRKQSALKALSLLKGQL